MCIRSIRATAQLNCMDNSGFLSPEEVGKMFRASKWTVRRWVEAGKLPAVRVGRRLLIPADAVERMKQLLSPADVTYRLVRGPAPRPDYFAFPMSDVELSKLAGIIISALHSGGWPYDIYELKEEGVKRMLLGEEKVPPAIWRYLCVGIERLRADVSATDIPDELKSSER
jgi:excisionase family DNA binding protein